MAARVPQRKIDDCRELYLRFGGLDHDRIVREMHGRGWRGFTKRNLYARTRHGRVTPGWPERFGWVLLSEPPAPLLPEEGCTKCGVVGVAGGLRRRPGKPGPAYLNRSARERTTLPRAEMLIPPRPGFNHQKARRLRKATPVNSANSPNSPNSANSPNSDDFHAWLKTLPGILHWDWRHQMYLYHRLKKVTDGSCKRLMIFMPPRHGKSEMVTVRYSAWRLKQDPSMNIILGSYNQRLADCFSRKIRRVLCDDAGILTAESRRRGEDETENGPFPKPAGLPNGPNSPGGSNSPSQRLRGSAVNPNPSPFPFARPRPVNTVSEWETSQGGGLRAVGVGGGVTGYGASLIVIDDPVKSREQAGSERFREKLWDWFNDDLYTRLEPGGAIILIQTRWHEDDLAGRLLKQMHDGGEQWEVVSLPALAEDDPSAVGGLPLAGETRSPDGLQPLANRLPRIDPIGRLPGEALCPARYDRQELERIRSTMAEYSFASLYQQRPVPQEGGVFKRKWFTNIVGNAPQGLKWKRGWDLAVSIKQTADYTASFRVAYDKDGNLYIDGGIRRRIDFPEQRRLIIERMRLETDTEHGIELAIHGRAVMQELRQLPAVRGRRLTGVPVSGDKQLRALSWIRLAEEGHLRLVRGPWNKAFVEEACSFPHGTRDDQIDAVSLAVSMHERKPSKLYVF